MVMNSIGETAAELLAPGAPASNEEQSLLVDEPAARDEHEAGEILDGGDNEWSYVPNWRRPSIIWLVVPFCLFTTAFGMIAVPRLNIILSLICRQYFAERGTPASAGSSSALSQGQCKDPQVQALVSRFTLYMGLISGVLGAITSPRLGQLSDRYGRKLFMGLSSLGLLASEVCTILAALYPDTISVNIILLGSVCDGLCGSFLLGQAVASSYAADCTPSHKRSVAFGYFTGCLYLGIAIGPAVGSMIIEATGDVLNVFYTALAGCVAFMLYVVFILPESLSKSRMIEARTAHTSKISQYQGEGVASTIRRHANIFEPLRILLPSGPFKLKRNMLLLAAIDTVLFGVGMGSMTVIVLYAGVSFGWGNIETGYFMSIVNSTRVTLLFVAVPLLARYLRSTLAPTTSGGGANRLDIMLIRFAVVAEVLGYAGYSLARTGWQFTLAGMLVSLGGAGSPTIQSALTKHVPPSHTGQLLGAIALLHSLARVLSPLVFNSIYAFVIVRGFASGVFVCLASTFCIAAVCCLGIKSGVGYTSEEDTSVLECVEDEIIQPST